MKVREVRRGKVWILSYGLPRKIVRHRHRGGSAAIPGVFKWPITVRNTKYYILQIRGLRYSDLAEYAGKSK